MKEERPLRALLRALIKKERIAGDCDLFLVSNREMNMIKRQLSAMSHFKGPEARKIRGERMVNVLAFPAREPFPGPKTKKHSLGEIYINRDWAKGERALMRYLLIHGFLHLRGYRHMRKNDRIMMEQEEARLCKAFRIPFPPTSSSHGITFHRRS